MNASEMTNNELAKELVYMDIMKSSITKEAAARLRKFGGKRTVCAASLTACEAEVAALRAKLKVAEDALEELRNRLVASVYDGTISPHEALKIAENALVAIHKEGGAK